LSNFAKHQLTSFRAKTTVKTEFWRISDVSYDDDNDADADLLSHLFICVYLFIIVMTIIFYLLIIFGHLVIHLQRNRLSL